VAALQLLHRLAAEPLLGRFLELFVYPVCNPWGFDANRREGESGRDLNRLFWQEEYEVLLLEQELLAKRFDGIIALHTDDTSEGIYGYVNGSTSHPPPAGAVRSAPPPPFSQGTGAPKIDTHPAEASIITGGYSGILSAPPDQHPKPFEIVFETPRPRAARPAGRGPSDGGAGNPATFPSNQLARHGHLTEDRPRKYVPVSRHSAFLAFMPKKNHVMPGFGISLGWTVTWSPCWSCFRW